MTDSPADVDETASKVGRVVEAYDLAGLGAELERRWTTTDGERWSLRDLADYFNEQVLRAALERQGVQPSDAEVENAYRTLADDDVDPSILTQTERELERNGVDVAAVSADFVSHQAVHTYLTKYRDASPPSPEGASDPGATAERAINRLQSRTAAVVRSNVDRLRSTDTLAVGDPDVFVTVEVFCRECGVSRPFGQLVDAGGCDCPDDPTESP